MTTTTPAAEMLVHSALCLLARGDRARHFIAGRLSFDR